MAKAEKKPFSLGDALASTLGSVPKSGTSVSGAENREQIEYIDLTALDADENNFYSLDGLDELVANIELIGLQQPLRVRPNPDMPGRYFVVSGHRRRAALLRLAEEFPSSPPDGGEDGETPTGGAATAGRWDKVPCIVEQPAGSAALQELRLIYANSDTRKMSSADLSKQAERVEALLYQLKEEGYDFPGRMRDHVAEACKVSKTKLATLKVIREGLVPRLRALWEAGMLVESSAHTLAKETADIQKAVIAIAGGEEALCGLPEYRIGSAVTNGGNILSRECTVKRGVCWYSAALFRHLSEAPYDNCGRMCCANCYARERCKDLCPEARAEVEKEKAEREADEKQRAAAREEHQKREAARIRQAWINVGNAAKAKGLGTTEAMKAIGIDPDLDEDDIAAIEAQFAGTATSSWGDAEPWTYWDAADALATADALGCSVDYLLGRNCAPTPVPPAEEGEAKRALFVVVNNMWRDIPEGLVRQLAMAAGLSTRCKSYKITIEPKLANEG